MRELVLTGLDVDVDVEHARVDFYDSRRGPGSRNLGPSVARYTLRIQAEGGYNSEKYDFHKVARELLEKALAELGTEQKVSE